jgi:hypothetical protein
MDGVYDSRRIVIQRKSIVYPNMIDERKFVEGGT